MSMYGKCKSNSREDRMKATDIVCGPSMTKQSFADETDINKIVEKFSKTGMLSNLASGEPFYGDVSEIVDYQEALHVIQKAEDLFMKMDPAIRDRFHGDPQEMIDFLADDRNRPEAEKLGMVLPKPISDADLKKDPGAVAGTVVPANDSK